MDILDKEGVSKLQSWASAEDPFKPFINSIRVFSNVFEGKTSNMKKFISLEEFKASSRGELCTTDEEVKKEYLKFLETFRVRIEGRAQNFYKDREEDYFGIRLLMVQPDVAKTKEDFNPATHKFYITDIEEQAKETGKLVTEKIKAFGVLSKMSPLEQRDLLILYGEDTKTFSDIVVAARLSETLERNPSKFLSLYNNKYKPDLIFLKKLISSSLVVLSGGVYKFGEGDGTILGSSEEQVLSYLTDPKHQALKIQMKRDLEERTQS